MLEDRYGGWIVLDKTPKKISGIMRVLCKCICGLESSVRYHDLIRGKSTRCVKCNGKNEYSEFPKRDLTGQTVGEWEILKPIKKRSKWHWQCKCSCGKIKDIPQSDLLSGKSTRCHSLKSKDHHFFKGYGCISGSLFNRIQKGARVRGIDFSISIEELHLLAEKQNFLCALTGVPLVFPYTTTNSNKANASLDRIDSDGGYYLENVHWVTISCNLAKQSLNKRDFINLCIGVTMNYLKDSEKTENKDYLSISERVIDGKVVQLLHAAMGLDTESGEIMDTLKRHIIYGSELNEINIKEELGDLMWYMALACRAIGTDFDQICSDNIAKLSKRYPDKFDKDKAENRNIENELSHYSANLIGEAYYAFEHECGDNAWWVVEKDFWHQNNYVDDTQIDLQIPGFVQSMESCFHPVDDRVGTNEAENILKALGFTILDE